MKNLYGTELLKELCDIIAPSGAELPVAEAIIDIIKDTSVEISCDKVGNVVALKKGNGKSDIKIMVSAHMDEVGFLITGIDADGRLSFANAGGIDPSVLGARAVKLLSKNGVINGVMSAKPVHLLSPAERTKVSCADDLRIDIGASSREDAEKYISIGAVGTFASDFTRFGDSKMLKGKAIDDRFGCAIMCDIIREYDSVSFDYDVYFAFTTREEIGFSGILTTTERIAPDISLVLESTAVADLADVPEHSRVAYTGEGPAVSFMDRSTVYHSSVYDFVLKTAKENGIKAQPKRFVSGGNDAAYIHSALEGTATAAISIPTRYLHSASCVIAEEDYFSTKDLILAIMKSDTKELSQVAKGGKR
ncbi:MAG: M42 family peptidase [Clostridia bacterium]|nr:M42 family peptidase [Clostridia bacterium]